MARNRNRKVVRYRKPFQINIEIVIFCLIFIYLLYFIYQYMTDTHISAYEVTQGSIAQNTTFEGLILREETVYYAADSGYIHYYYRDGTKAGAGSCIYSLDATGDYYQQMTAQNDGELLISDESYREMEEVAGQFLASYSNNDFQRVYQFKYDMEATLMEALSQGQPQDAPEAAGSLRMENTPKDGVVVYNRDGLEEVTADTFTAEMFDTQSYRRENFMERETVSPDDAVYKLITSEFWQVVIPITEGLAADLAEEENIKVRFWKDNTTVWAASRTLLKDGAWYLILDFKNSMIRFATERYVKLELLLTDTSGLKIPNTAITSKDFLVIPKNYITKGGDSGEDGILKEYLDEKGNAKVEFTPVTLFYETEDAYYIDGEGVSVGDTALLPDSNERFLLKELASLEGVYNVNKGYAVFKRIEKLFENEEYTIINTGTSYGISMYDHIALDSSSVEENDIIH